MSKISTINNLKLILFTACLGGVSGIVVWCFINAVSFCSSFFVQFIPERFNFPYATIFLCAIGGLILGIIHKFFGQYPESLAVILKKIKIEKKYDYRPIIVIIICSFIPLVLGGSVGPEAGLTGIIAGLCYWISENLIFARQNTLVYSEIGEVVTLSHIFHSPLFGIFAVEEEEKSESDDCEVPKQVKLLYYGISVAMSFMTISVLNIVFKTSISGFPKFYYVRTDVYDYLLLFVYMSVGILLYLCFEFSEKITSKIAIHIPVIVREVLCGIVIAIVGCLAPMLLFSGEEEMSHLADEFQLYTPWFLFFICVLKIFVTSFCINFGWKGGHFFPLIFACVCMGFGLSMLIFKNPADHMVFSAGIVTAATLGAQLKKPFAVSALLLLCFPVDMIFWIFLVAVISGKLSQITLLKKYAKI